MVSPPEQIPPSSPPPPPSGPGPSSPGPQQDPLQNKKLVAGILGIVLGGLGVHKFYLGYTQEGIIMLVACLALSAITCGIASPVLPLIGLIEGIIYLTKPDEEFNQTYVVNKKPWF